MKRTVLPCAEEEARPAEVLVGMPEFACRSILQQKMVDRRSRHGTWNADLALRFLSIEMIIFEMTRGENKQGSRSERTN